MSNDETTITFKAHDQRELVNLLRDTAIEHAGKQNLRDSLAHVISTFIKSHKQEQTK